MLKLLISRLPLLALLAWTVFALAVETRRARRVCDVTREPETFVDRWRVGGLQWRELASFAEWLELVVPAGEVVAFRAPEHRSIAWSAAYLLPRHEVVPVLPATAWDQAAYVAIFDEDWEDPDRPPLFESLDLTLIFEHPAGRVYRVERAP